MTKTTTRVTASYIYSGMIDYWGGNGRRWDDDAGCVFAGYDGTTTLRQLIDELVSDFNGGGDCESSDWADVTSEDVRQAILDSLTDQGRADYAADAISEFALDYAAANEGEDLNDDCELPQVIFLLELESDAE